MRRVSDPASSGRTVRILALAVTFGAAFGLGAYTFTYAEGSSYFSDDPSACLNCHVMRQPYEAWSHSSHRAVSTCNDCHTPQGFIEKWLVKGLNGWNHSTAFTTGNFAEPIRIHTFNAQVVQRNCVACHQALVSLVHRSGVEEELACVACHTRIGHTE